MMKTPDFTTTLYLREGTASQRECFRILETSGITAVLTGYDPVVVGTIPIGIDIPGSDIDILCNTKDFAGIESKLRKNYGTYDGFACDTKKGGDLPAFVCGFNFEGVEIEVFAQDRPVTEQNGYRHMITEYALLQMYGDDFRDEIIKLKKSGIKTEPAFARILGLGGDPYEAVLEKGEELDLFGTIL